MSGHSRWATVNPQPDPHDLEVQMAYVDGYILALEDLQELVSDARSRWLNALTGLDAVVVEAAITRYVDSLFKDVNGQITLVLDSARATRKTFREVARGTPQ
jgi:hypothetical protein